MKNSKIHLGLQNSDLRDFLSISMVKNQEQEFNNKKQAYSSNIGTVYEKLIKDCENEIEFHNKKLEILKERQSIITLMKMQGWDEFDVSDDTQKDLGYILRMNFIGTSVEYDNFINSLDND